MSNPAPRGPTAAAKGRQSMASGRVQSGVRSIALQDVELGRLHLATALDEDYARELSELSARRWSLRRADRSWPAPQRRGQTSSQDRCWIRRTEPFTLQLDARPMRHSCCSRPRRRCVFPRFIDASASPALAAVGRSALMIDIRAFALAGLQSVDGHHSRDRSIRSRARCPR